MNLNDLPESEVQSYSLLERDVLQASALDHASFPVGWSPQDFRRLRHSPDSACRVLIDPRGGDLLAFLALRTHEDHFEVLQLAVAPAWRGRGLAGFLLAELIARMVCSDRQRALEVLVPETWDAQVRYWSAVGLRAYEVERGAFSGPGWGPNGLDGYRMRWALRGAPLARNPEFQGVICDQAEPESLNESNEDYSSDLA
jgi:GNAT superfamily N-acetyltransferase